MDRFLKVFFLLGIGFSSALSSLAKEDEWPKVGDLKVGEKFKFPILGIKEVTEMRPTQAAVGYMAIDVKMKEMEEILKDGGVDALKEFLKEERIPVVAAPDGNFYMIDHHHQAVAAYQIDRKDGKYAYYVLKEDFSKFSSMDEFWDEMKEKKWVRAFDENGKKIRIPRGLPLSILELKDDIYRSFAWFVRKAGGYKKTAVEFAEFLWADFFRGNRKIKINSTMPKDDFQDAIKVGVEIAHSPEAKSKGLPGWTPSGEHCNDLLNDARQVGKKE